MKLSDITEELDICIESNIEISGLNTLQDATKNEISFLENKKYLSNLKETKALFMITIV